MVQWVLGSVGVKDGRSPRSRGILKMGTMSPVPVQNSRMAGMTMGEVISPIELVEVWAHLRSAAANLS